MLKIDIMTMVLGFADESSAVSQWTDRLPDSQSDTPVMGTYVCGTSSKAILYISYYSNGDDGVSFLFWLALQSPRRTTIHPPIQGFSISVPV